MTRYGFRGALGAYFLADTSALGGWIPRSIRPIEVHPGLGLLAVTAFDFTDSGVGAYGELVVSALVSPFAERDGAMPHAATFPIRLATTTAESRAHATQRWALPQYGSTVSMRFRLDGEVRSVVVEHAGKPVLSLSVTHGPVSPSRRLYQVFSESDVGIHRVNLQILGDLSEHQEQTARLVLGDHELVEGMEPALFDDEAYLEQSMGLGHQQFSEFLVHRPHA